jgi:AcrR family transcriptional regulator
MTPAGPATSDRPLRADARRNRERVLEAARAAFAEEGLDAQMPDIARRAGVGVGTVYRHFPTKDALIDALARAHFTDAIALAEERVAAGGDPWEAFSGLLWDSARRFVEDRGLAEIASNQPEAMRRAAQEHAALHELVDTLVARAHAAGVLREDASGRDVDLIMCGLGRVAMLDEGDGAVRWDRYLTLMLEGLRAR